MKIFSSFLTGLTAAIILCSCGKDSTTPPVVPVTPDVLNIQSISVNGIAATNNAVLYGVTTSPVLKFKFSAPLNHNSVSNALLFNEAGGAAVSTNISYERGDSTLVIQPVAALKNITQFVAGISANLQSQKGSALQTSLSLKLVTAIDSTDKFPRVSESALLDIIQKQTFKYFWDFGHPVSGLARERNTSGDLVTSGGSGFGIMSIVTAVNRSFISRAEGLARMQKIVGFLSTKAEKFHGAFPHWLDGNTGKVIPFSTKDNGADLVETSFLMQGLLTARQYFSGADAAETALRNDINALWNGVEWSWFRQNDQNVLYWHWSPDYAWQMNVKLQGWNEALITYILAAASPAYSIPKVVYDNGWANNGALKNGNVYYGITLPLGPALGGPLFFEHYSFLGINPKGLTDAYANYEAQTTNHTLINYNYCVANPRGFYGYSNACWGLTASDDNKNGYLAHEPNNDDGVISPTAAISSLPYTPVESMRALEFFYYKLGDKIFKDYGFTDAFSLNDAWFANSYLAIDQGPMIVMIENYRSNLLWNLFMSCPEIKTGMKKLGFQSPNL